MSDTTVVEGEEADEAAEPTAPLGPTTESSGPRTRTERRIAIDGRRRYVAAYTVGAFLATLLFAFTLTGGSFDFEQHVNFADEFYDVQARRLFDGHWDMPVDVVAVEGYRHNGKLYMYFGPVPAFLRMPVLAATDVGDGDLTREWMVAAFATALAAAGVLGWRIRRLARGAEPFGWGEAGVVAFAAFAIGGGSTLLYLGSGPWVYHEAILWGIAFSLAAFAAIVAWVERPRWSAILLAGTFTLCAVGSRFTVALGPVIALGAFGAVVLVSRVWSWSRRAVAPRAGLRDDAITWPVGASLGAAALLPVALYAWLNTKKFGTLFSVPYDHQLLNLVQKNRFEVLAANDNSLFRLDAIPTALYQYFRPDAIGFRSDFPWLQFPTWKPSVFGDLLYDHRDRTSSIPASMPLLLGLALIGLAAVVVARRRDSGPTLAALRVPAIGAALAVLPSLAFIFLTQRYLGDAVPVLVLLGLAGLFAALAWLGRGGRRRRTVAAVAAVALVAIGTFGVLANFGMARDWQRDHLPPAQRFPADRR